MGNALGNLTPPGAAPGGMDPTMMTPPPIQDGSPYFMGDHALVKFTTGVPAMGGEQYWLVDKSKNFIIPFASENAIHAAFAEDAPAAIQGAVSVVPPSVSPQGEIQNGIFTGFHLLGPEYAIQDDGSAKALDYHPGQISKRYGKPIDEQAEEKAIIDLEGLLGVLKQEEQGLKMAPGTIDKIMANTNEVALYISALAYGGYDANDVYKEIIRKAHLERGG